MKIFYQKRLLSQQLKSQNKLQEILKYQKERILATRGRIDLNGEELTEEAYTTLATCQSVEIQ